MNRSKLTAALLGIAVLPVIAAGGCGSSGSQGQSIIVYAFSALENVLKEEIIPAFEEDWVEKTGQKVQIITSFAGSGTITNQIIFGAPAQVALIATEVDATHIRESRKVTIDSRGFGNRGSFAYSVAGILTREGNPKGLHSFEDLTKPGINVVYPDPTTSGGAQWGILAVYGSALKTTQHVAGIQDPARAREILKGVSLNAGSLPESARRALTQFGLGYGDALITYENEALLDISRGRTYELIVPESTILIEPKVLIIDANVREGENEVVTAFVEFLWSKTAQEAFAGNNFRVLDEAIMDGYSDRYIEVARPFTVDYLGGWKSATSVIINGIWRDIQREIR